MYDLLDNTKQGPEKRPVMHSASASRQSTGNTTFSTTALAPLCAGYMCAGYMCAGHMCAIYDQETSCMVCWVSSHTTVVDVSRINLSGSSHSKHGLEQPAVKQSPPGESKDNMCLGHSFLTTIQMLLNNVLSIVIHHLQQSSPWWRSWQLQMRRRRQWLHPHPQLPGL